MTISAKPPVYDLSVETIYLDSLFALNAIIDYLLLLCSCLLYTSPSPRD